MENETNLYLLFNHTLTKPQIDDAHNTLKVKNIIYFPQDILNIWRDIPSDIKKLKPYLLPIFNYIKEYMYDGDYLLVQGDFGATYMVVEFAKENKIIPIYATTKRETVEKMIDGKFVKTSIFSHVRYRVYGE